MKQIGFKVRASIDVEKSVVHPLSTDWRPIVRCGGRMFPAGVVECDRPIASGQTGIAWIYIMNESEPLLEIAEGSTFDLIAAPDQKLATATVLTVIRDYEAG